MKKIYLCPSLKQREELFNEFMVVFGEKHEIVRWKDCPPPSEHFIGVCDDVEHDKRGKCLKAKGVTVVPSAWLRACIAIKRFVALPNNNNNNTEKKKPVQPIPAVVETLPMASVPWSRAQDDVVRAIHELKQRKDYTKALRFECLLVDKLRTKQDIQQRERELFPL